MFLLFFNEKYMWLQKLALLNILYFYLVDKNLVYKIIDLLLYFFQVYHFFTFFYLVDQNVV